jgi:RNA polymerase sigma-70 factor (ECF subfamily)
MDESEAIVRLKKRDLAGLEPLVEMYQAPAVQAAYLITGDRQLAEDVVQAAYLRVIDRIDGFDANRPFRPWFMRIVVNSAVDTVRGARRRSSGDNDDAVSALLELIPDSSPGPEDAAASTELRPAVLSALDGLPPEQRAAIVMRYYLGLSEEEMVGRLAVPAGTVKWRLHAARSRLRSLLAARGSGRRHVG